jgi:hypothetical protein
MGESAAEAGSRPDKAQVAVALLAHAHLQQCSMSSCAIVAGVTAVHRKKLR